MSNRIKFTAGTLIKISAEYYNLILMKGTTEVYKATVNTLDAAELINKHDSIKLITPNR